MHMAQSPPIYSRFGTDDDMIELVEEFVAALPERVAAIESAVRSEDLEALRRLAHQLKGASGGYGFDEIGRAAGALDASARAASAVHPLDAQVRELVSLCRRARAREGSD